MPTARKKHLFRPIGVILLVLQAAACSIPAGLDFSDDFLPVTQVLLGVSKQTLVPGETTQCSANPVNRKGQSKVRVLTWTSSANAVATVSASGLVSAVSPGTAQIRATTGDVTGEITVTVIASPTVVVVDLSTVNRTMVLNQTVVLTATPRDPQGHIVPARVVTWSSSAMEVATVSTSGLVSAVALGTATITATIEGKTGQAEFTVQTVSSAAELALGNAYSCARTTTADVLCWGNRDARLPGGPIAYDLVPILVNGGLAIGQLAAGESHTCGLTSEGVAYCWGPNSSGQLGDGTTTDRFTPTLVSGNLAFVNLTAWHDQTCGLTAEGSAYCWGGNDYGQLGDGTRTSRSTPTLVDGNLVFLQLVAGYSHTCGLTRAGVVYCWGNNSGGLDVRPILVSADLVFVELVGRGSLACARTISNAVYCWGNTYGPVPVQVSGSLAFVKLAGGYVHACGLTSEGAAYCWGFNTSGQLGDGTLLPRAAPTPVRGGLTFVELAAGYAHNCGRTASNDVYCWGSGDGGTLGDGTRESRLVPVRVLWP